MKILLAVLTWAAASLASAGVPLAPGDVAPDFKRPSTTGQDVKLSELRGKKVVLAFFPKAGTPGCTKEMSAFRDRLAEFTSAGALVLGMSIDDIESQKKFARDIQVTFPLLSDPEGEVAEAYGVKSLGFAKRVTFVIDKGGKIAAVFDGKDALDPAGALASCKQK
jgi:peroxiredoxin Q/BCP